jgi:hypothetical protein
MTPDSQPPIPDPNGPPVSSARTQKLVRRAVSTSIKVVIGGAAALLVLAAVPTRTMGALRSQRIKWQERRQEIAEVQAQSGAAEAPADVAQAGERGHD